MTFVVGRLLFINLLMRPWCQTTSNAVSKSRASIDVVWFILKLLVAISIIRLTYNSVVCCGLKPNCSSIRMLLSCIKILFSSLSIFSSNFPSISNELIHSFRVWWFIFLLHSKYVCVLPYFRKVLLADALHLHIEEL